MTVVMRPSPKFPYFSDTLISAGPHRFDCVFTLLSVGFVSVDSRVAVTGVPVVDPETAPVAPSKGTAALSFDIGTFFR